MSRRYALFDAGHKGASLSVENGGTLLVTTAAGLDRNRSCRSTVSVIEDDSDVEFIVHGPPNASPSLSGKISIGLCTADADMNFDVGGEMASVGYTFADGGIYNDNALLASVAAGQLGDIIRVAVAFNDGGSADVAWYRNGALLATVALPATMESMPLYFAVSLGSDTEAGDIRVKVQPRSGGMKFPGSGFNGWWEPRALVEAIRIATVDYLSHHDDDLPSLRWHGGITGRSGGDSRGFSVWWWGGERQVQGSVLQVEVTDPDGGLDPLLSGSYRDQPVTLRILDHDAALADSEETQTWYFDRCEVNDDLRKTLYLRDVISLMDLPLQEQQFRPDDDPQAANRWMPTLLGVAGSIPVTLVDADISSAPEPTYQISGQDVEEIGKVREAGVPLSAVTPDYTLLIGGRQIQIHHEPTGEITLDAARTGAGYIPPSPVDALDGTGNPFAADSSGDLVGWDRFQDDPSINDNVPYYFGSGQVAFPQGSSALSHIISNLHQLVLGQRYRYEYTVVDLIERGDRDAEIGFSYSIDRFQAIHSVRSTLFYQGNPDGNPQTYKGTFVSEQTVYPSFFYYGMEDNAPGRPGRIRNFTLIELPPLNDTGDDEAVEDALPAQNLEDGQRMVIETHAGLPSSVWSSADAAAIDLETGSAGGGTFFDDQTTRREALERYLPGYTAGIYRGRDGTLRTMRMKLPEDEIGSDPITVNGSEFFGDLVITRDSGSGLTRQLGVRKNFRPLTDADVDTEVLNPSQRARLARQFRYVVATGASLAPSYDHADAMEPLDTHLWFPADGQAEIDFAGQAYEIGRAFYSPQGGMPYRADLDIGTVALLVYDRYGMTAGIPVVVVSTVEDRINDRFDSITFWGPAPYEEF